MLLVAALLSACGGGGGGGSADVTISGRVSYERVPFSSATGVGLDYAATTELPAREIVVELLTAGQAVLVTTTTDGNGNYTLTAPANLSVFVRAKSQSRRSSSPTRNLRVLNNTNGNALYVLDSATFNTGTANQTRNLLALSGWGGSSYNGTRAAAPFAVLDTLYAAAEFVRVNGSSSLNLPPLDAYWSPENKPTPGNVSDGNITTTLYRSSSSAGTPAGIYILGFENNDTDEYDQHILAHEFNHFLEGAIGRTDTPGGTHSLNERLDLRLAFSEGFANAFSAMVLNDPVYSESFGARQAQRFSFDLESNVAAPAGWFNEASIQSLAWDLFDAPADGLDAVALGYLPLFEAFTGPLKSGAALTSFYPLLASVRGRAGAPVAAIDALAAAQEIDGVGDYGSGETNNGSVLQSLPVYSTLVLNGGAQTVCGTRTAGTFNTLGNRLFLRFTLPAAGTVTILAQYEPFNSTAPFLVSADPDIVLYEAGFLDSAETTTPDVEDLTRALQAGEYVIEVYEYSHVDPSASQRRGNTCFNVTVTG